ncbi:MAG: dihydroorotate dehydrogenase [Candidatus Dormibacteria bacterium]
MAFDASVDLGRGLVLRNPIGVASGTFGYGFEAERMGTVDSLGVIYSKGTTLLPRVGNLPPRIAETTAGMLNSIGLQNPGVEVVATSYAQHWSTWPVPVVVNVAGADLTEYVRVCARLSGVAGVAGFELNISCPNISHGLDFGTDPRRAAALVSAVRGETELPLMVKLTPNVTDITEVGRAVQDAGADCVSAVNTYLGMKVSLARRAPVLPGQGTAGLSGPAIKPLAVAAVARLRQALSIPIVGMGGIASAQDALEFMVAGADAVQIGTANFYRPGIAAEVVRECLEFAQAEGISNWSELRWRVAPDGS